MHEEQLITRHLFESDLSAEQAWQLLDWCLAHGASEFSVDRAAIEDTPAPACDAFEAALAPWSRGVQRRRVVANPTTCDRSDNVHVWALNAETVAVLRAFGPEHLFTYELDMARGWLEDPVVWRDEQVMLAIISHEQEGLLRVTPEEVALLGALGLPTRDVGEWVGY
jgi:hypothetical protein